MFPIKPQVVADEMFPDGPYMDEDGSGGALPLDMSTERFVHADFDNDFGDLFDEDNLE